MANAGITELPVSELSNSFARFEPDLGTMAANLPEARMISTPAEWLSWTLPELGFEANVR